MASDTDLAKRRHLLWSEIRRLADQLFVLTDEWLELDPNLHHLEHRDIHSRHPTRPPVASTSSSTDDQS